MNVPLIQPNHKTRGIDLREYVMSLSEEIALRVAHERDVILAYLDGEESEGGRIAYCPLVNCGPQLIYRAALQEAVTVLEETRRSFKSRQLEELRKKLQAVLAEDIARKL